jgi:hypothetical protein
MVTDQQVRRLMKSLQKGKSLSVAAARSGMDEKTARKYRKSGLRPSQCRAEHTWRTRADPFVEVWSEIEGIIKAAPGLEAKTVFEEMKRRHTGRFAEGQLRTLQRRIKVWRAMQGPAKEVYFPQEHHPGELCQSDFTHMSALGVTIKGQRFAHLIYHFVLTYSNWETGSICFSESFESLSEGMQKALFELGGIPQAHRTDRLSAAIHSGCNAAEFTHAYRALLGHYGLEAQMIQAGKANENGDVEQSHHRFKRAVEQALLLRGSWDFQSREEYEKFIRDLIRQRNAGRQERFNEERKVLRRLPERRLEDSTREDLRVGPSSTIRLKHNTYSVDSRLIGETVNARLYAERIEVWYAQRKVDEFPRLRGEYGHRINYRHVIEWLVRKPGAFKNYRYREDMFPSSTFRMAYDALKKQPLTNATKEYLKILHVAAKETESGVENALRVLLDGACPLSVAAVENLLQTRQKPTPAQEIEIAEVNLASYDALLSEVEVA